MKNRLLLLSRACAPITGLLLMSAPAERADAQIFGPLPPQAPSLRAPAAGATAAAGSLNDSPGTDAHGQLLDLRPTLVWRHGGLRGQFPRPAPPTHFAVCLFSGATPAPCSDGNATWLMPVGMVPSAPSSPLSGGLPGQYDYTFRAPADAPQALLDRGITWTVAACAPGTMAMTCSPGQARGLWLSTKNLTARRALLRDSRGHNLSLTWEVLNKGSSNSGPFFTQIDFWHVLMTPGEACQRDPNAAQVNAATDVVIARGGALMPVAQLPLDAAGRRIAPPTGVQAIYRTGAWKTNPSFGHFNPGLPVDPADRAFPLGPFNVTSPGQIPVPSAYATRTILDVALAVREFDESENNATECHVVRN